MASSSDFTALSLNEQTQIEDVCERFETAWRNGDTPALEHALQGWDGQLRFVLLRELLPIEWHYRRQQNQTTLRAEELLKLHESLATEIESVLPELELQEATNSLTAAPTVSAPPPVSEVTPRTPKPAESTPDDTLPEHIGKYRVLALLDSGGQGDVYRVVHPGLAREYVVKISRHPAELTDERHQLLAQEGRLLAELDHPHLARVIDLDVHEDRPYLVMEYVRGRNLRQYVQEHTVSAREAAELVMKLARAIAVAHKAGVVHRDLKPANVIIDAAEQPRIIDFGLAQLRDAYSDTTDPQGSISGTPSFMAPEQARGETANITARTDVFALGGILYWLLTGQAPFGGGNVRQVLHNARECRFRREALTQSGIPQPLAAVCLKAMNADPNRRYRSAEELANVLEAEITPDSSRDGAAKVSAPSVRRRRWLKWGSAAIFAAGCVGVIIAAIAFRGGQDVGDNSADSRKTSPRQTPVVDNGPLPFTKITRDDLRPELKIFDASAVEVTEGPRWSVQVKASPAVMKTFGYGGPDCFYSLDGENYTKAMSWSWFDVHNAADSDRIFLRFRSFEGEEIGPFEYSLDFKNFAISQLKQRLEQRQDLVNCGNSACRLNWQIARSLAAIDRIEYAFDPEFAGTQALHVPDAAFSKYFDEEWAQAHGFRRDNLIGAPRMVIKRMPDAERLYYRIVYRDGDVGKARTAEFPRRRNAGGRQPKFKRPRQGPWKFHSVGRGHRHFVLSVAFDDTGKRLLSSGFDGAICEWHVGANTIVRTRTLGAQIGGLGGGAPTTSAAPIPAIALSPNGRLLASAEGKHIRLWNLQTGKVLNQIGNLGRYKALAFNDDGSLLAAVKGKLVELWDVQNSKAVLKRAPIQHGAGANTRVLGIAFSPNGKSLATAGRDWKCKIWDVKTGKCLQTIEDVRPLWSVAFSPDGKHVAIGGATVHGERAELPVSVWNVSDGKQIHHLTGHSGTGNFVINDLAYSPDGVFLASGSSDGTVRIWDTKTGRGVQVLKSAVTGADPGVRSVDFSPDGNLLAVARQNRTIEIWKHAETDE